MDPKDVKGKDYFCEECKEEETVKKGDVIPECCGKPMKPLEVEGCVSAPASAEHARPMDKEEPCDDYRKG